MRILSAKATKGERAGTKYDSRERGSASRREQSEASERCPPPKIETLSENSRFVFFKEGQLFQYSVVLYICRVNMHRPRTNLRIRSELRRFLLRTRKSQRKYQVI